MAQRRPGLPAPRIALPECPQARVDRDTSLQYLDGLLQNTGGVMYVIEATTSRFLLVNPAFEELVGRPADEILGASLHELFPAELADVYQANNLLVLTDGQARTARELAPHRDGSLREYVSHKFALVDPDGVRYAVGGISTDVTALETERRITQDAQQASEARFRAVFDHAPVGQIFSGSDGRVADVNAALATMLGYRTSDMIGRSVADFVSPDEYARIAADAHAILDRQNLTAHRRFRHRDGHDVPVRVTSAVLRDEHGAPRWWVSMAIDVSEEERGRTELERAHRDAVAAARRLRLLHAVAGAANDASELADAAPALLKAVCDHFDWWGGALTHWSPADGGQVPAVHVAPGHGSALTAQALAQSALGVTADDPHLGAGPILIAGEPVLSGSATGGLLVVLPLPLPSGSAEHIELVFAAGDDNLDAEDRALLDLIAIETTRVAERQASGQRLRDSEERFRSVFAGSPLPMALSFGTSGKIGEVNAAFCELLGHPADELVGHSVRDFTHPDDLQLTDPAGAAALAAPDRQHTFDLRMLHSSGRVLDTVTTLRWMEAADGTLNLLGQTEDVTARRQAEESLRRQAEQDPLTGLANRSHLARLLRQKAATATECAVLFLDLDGFKLINDSCGHDVGDEVLIEVARRMRRAVRPSDTVARFGGDEFVVLCDERVDRARAETIARRIEADLARPIDTSSGQVRITASVGIADGAIPLENPGELLQRADTAMYHAKRLGKDRSEVYDAEMHRVTLLRTRTEASLRNALVENRFIVHYQPIVGLATGAVTGFEALVRLVDEHGVLVPPDSFISVAEQSGLIIPMGTWVLREACRTIAELRTSTGQPYTVAVNVAASQVARPDIRETVTAALADAGLDESALALELTESALLEADSSTLGQLNSLRSSGVQIALDDFGTGYSSLTYLRTFPVSHLKVDRSFVSGITGSSGDLAIVRAVAGLAGDLGLGCVAEGVETEQQRALVSGLGVGLAQGYLFSRPVPRQQLDQLLGIGNQHLARGA